MSEPDTLSQDPTTVHHRGDGGFIELEPHVQVASAWRARSLPN